MEDNSNYIAYLQNKLRDNHIEFDSQKQFETKIINTQQTGYVLKEKESLEDKPTLMTNIKEPLTASLIQRYSRQMLLKEIAYEGQVSIVQAKVAVIGAGGIGCPLALYLSAAGVGTIGLFDSDSVQITNLHRQIAHSTDRIGMSKTQSLKRTIQTINPSVIVQQHPFVTVENVHFLADYDIVIDGSDNPKCRYIVNDYCMSIGKKLLSGACIGWEAQITCYGGNSLCYRCLWGNDQVSLGGCSTLGVIGMVPGIVGLILAIQALKLIVDGESSVQGKLLTYDGKKCDFKKVALRKKQPACLACGQNKLDMTTYNYSKYTTCSNLGAPEQVQEVLWQNFLKDQLQSQKILDVRPSNIYNIVHFLNSENIPFEILKKMNKDEILDLLKITSEDSVIPVSCARGITSKLAAKYLNNIGIKAVSISGGLRSYKSNIDKSIPQL